MSLRRRKVDQSALRQDQQFTTFGSGMRGYIRLQLTLLLGDFGQGIQIDLVIEVPGNGHDRAGLHFGEVWFINNVNIASGRDEDVSLRRRVGHRHDPKSVHHCFQSAQRVNLGHDHMCAQSISA